MLAVACAASALLAGPAYRIETLSLRAAFQVLQRDTTHLNNGIVCHSLTLVQAYVAYGGIRMESMNISLPEPLKQFVDGQISTGRYSSASEYVRELIRADEKRKAEEELETKLLEGLRSPESELTKADWKAVRSEALARVKARSKTQR